MINFSSFKERFYLESKERLDRIEEIVLDIEQNGADKALMEEFQREVHTIKGSAKMIGEVKINELTHLLEDILIKYNKNNLAIDEKITDMFLSWKDVLRDLIDNKENYNKESYTKVFKLIQKLDTDDKADEQAETPSTSDSFDTAIEDNPLFAKLTGSQEKKGDKNLAKEAAPKAPTPVTPEKDYDIQIKKPKKKQTSQFIEKIKKQRQETVKEQKKYIKVLGEKVENLINISSDLLVKSFSIKNFPVNLKNYLKRINFISRKFANIPAVREFDEELINEIEAFQKLLLKDIEYYGKEVEHISNIFSKIHSNLIGLHLMPLSTLFSGYIRFIRDLSRNLNKKIRFNVEGGETKLDKNIIEKINASLVHLLRNALDHGIEDVESRLKAGKDETGSIRLKAYSKGNQVVIELADDGCGMDIEKIKNKIISKKLLPIQELEKLNESQILDFIFLPGFSTSEFITDISGRGVGMDVVKRTITDLNGEITIKSEPGEGTIFRLTLPISISTTRVVFIKDNQMNFACQVDLLRFVRRIKTRDLLIRDDRMYYDIDDTPYKVIPINPKEDLYDKEYRYILVTKVLKDNVGILVDEIHDEMEIAIKNFGQFIGKIDFLVGVAILEKNELAFVIDPLSIIESGNDISLKFKQSLDNGITQISEKKILLVEDSLIIQDMEKAILEENGFKVTTANNGVDALQKMSMDDFDLIVSDIEMPEMDGFELTRLLKENPDTKLIPVVIVSTLDKQEDRIRGLKVGANAYIAKKEFEQSNLIDTINRLI